MYKDVVIENHERRAAVVRVDHREWNSMSPVRRVLTIHELARDVTHGQPFEVLAVINVDGDGEDDSND